MKTLFKIFALCFLLGCFSDCKKYPENRFWGNPAKAKNCPFHGTITQYRVNGIDSLDLLDKYLDSSFAYSTHPPISVKDCYFEFVMPHSYEVNVTFFSQTEWSIANVFYLFSDDKKKISITFFNGYFLRKNLFISYDTEWEIVRLSKDSKPFKLKTTLSNGNTYEIQIR